MPAPETTAPDGSTFTTHDREKLVEVAVTLGFVKDALVEIKAGQATAVANARTDTKELEGRVRALENFRWWIMGGSAAAGAGAAAIAELVFKAIRPQ